MAFGSPFLFFIFYFRSTIVEGLDFVALLSRLPTLYEHWIGKQKETHSIRRRYYKEGMNGIGIGRWEGWTNGLQRQQWAEGDDALSSRYPRAIEESADYEIQANIESKQAFMNSYSPSDKSSCLL